MHSQLIEVKGSLGILGLIMQSISYHCVGWFSQVYQAIPRIPGWTPAISTGTAGVSVKRKTNPDDRNYAAKYMADAHAGQAERIRCQSQGSMTGSYGQQRAQETRTQ